MPSIHSCIRVTSKDWEPMTITLQALSLVEKVELVQVRFTLCLRDQQSMWMQDGCKVYMDSYMASNGSCFIVTWIVFNKPPLEDRPYTKSRDHGTPNAHNRCFILFYHVWGLAWMEIHWNGIWLRAWSHMTPHYYTWEPVTTLHDFGGVLGWLLDTFFWALTISWSRLLARVWSGPKIDVRFSHLTWKTFNLLYWLKRWTKFVAKHHVIKVLSSMPYSSL